MRLLALALLACGEPTSTGSEQPPPADQNVQLLRIATGLSGPVHLTSPPDDDRLFVVEQPGRIRIIRDGTLLATPFLDITAKVGSGGERGLLGLAFHPHFATNGFFYVDYTDRDGDTRVERYAVSSDPARADATSAKLILAVDQPFSNHNGGLVAFGPDGMLYIGLGDGGGGGDPHDNGQNRATLLGSLLRIDVDRGDPYAIPADNPFRSIAGARAEIWAWGLRNPWRFSFDRTAGRLFIADVGQNAWEEVNAVDAATGGLNYGWNVMEAAHCYPGGTGCDRSGLVLPILEYSHGDGCSITGGHVYRGAAIPSIQGHYFYADYCRGWVRSFRLSGDQVVDRTEWPFGEIGQVLSFGEDATGELYVLASSGGAGSVYRLVAGE
jgi:glucose/arabinose dehydrogenase